MNDVYIKKEDVNKWIGKYFNQDLISVDDLIGVIEDLDSEIENLNDKINELENKDNEEDWDEEGYMEREKLGI